MIIIDKYELFGNLKFKMSFFKSISKLNLWYKNQRHLFLFHII